MINKGFGGANTLTGLKFEKAKDVISLLKKTPGYSVKGNVIFYMKKEVAQSYKKYDLYRYLKSKGIDWESHLSKRLVPDEALYVIVNNTLFIIEMKFQKTEGSVDEKLQTCDFKKKQYQKLVASLNVEVEYIYLLSNWFKKPKYKDMLDYIISAGCHYHFNYLPLHELGLPVPTV